MTVCWPCELTRYERVSLQVKLSLPSRVPASRMMCCRAVPQERRPERQVKDCVVVVVLVSHLVIQTWLLGSIQLSWLVARCHFCKSNRGRV